MYARNLYNQPWRPEFFEIKVRMVDVDSNLELHNRICSSIFINSVHLVLLLSLFQLYSGFYKHQIESHLSNAESILELMGYKRIGDRLVINEPIDKERLRQVSLDTLKAKCECQVKYVFF